MSKETNDVEDDVKKILEALFYISPAYNKVTQMLFILPRRSFELFKMYPEIFEKEEKLKVIIDTEYKSDGTMNPKSDSMSDHLRNIFIKYFAILSDPTLRRQLLEIAGLNEEEFRKIDPLRKWLELMIDYTRENKPEALKLFKILVEKLKEKEPIYLKSEEWRNTIRNIRDAEALIEYLRENKLIILEDYETYIYRNKCPLLLEVYSDLYTKIISK